MSDFKQRLIDEKDELKDKRDKLQNFIGSKIYDELPKVGQSLLVIQLDVMNSYLSVLRSRISLLEDGMW